MLAASVVLATEGTALATQPCPEGTKPSGAVAFPVGGFILAGGAAAAIYVWRTRSKKRFRWLLVPLLFVSAAVAAVYAMGFILMMSKCV